jgi:hypothetical protein
MGRSAEGSGVGVFITFWFCTSAHTEDVDLTTRICLETGFRSTSHCFELSRESGHETT